MHPGFGIPSLLTWKIGAGQLLSSEVIHVLVPRYNPRTAADLQEESLGSCQGRKVRNLCNKNECQVLDRVFCQTYFNREKNGKKGGEYI